MAEDARFAPLDPARSCVITACAGSGKTWQLASRMLRLLLAGAEPGAILALTFTRKAAGEMRERLEDWAAQLADLPDADVIAFLGERGLAPDEARACLPSARLLAERIATADPPMAIDTFHGWFLRIVSLLPMSAPGEGADSRVKLPHGAALVESVGALTAEAWQRFAAALGRAPDSEVARAFGRLLGRLRLSNVRKAMFAILAKRAEWWAFTDGADSPADDAVRQLRAALGCEAGSNAAREFFTVHRADLEQFVRYMLVYGVREKAIAEEAEDVLSGARFDREGLRIVGSIWLTTQQKRRAPRKISAAFAKAFGPDDQQRFLTLDEALGNAFEAARDVVLHEEICDTNADVFACAQPFIDEFQRLKARRALVDFTDIEWLAAHALAASDQAAYLHARLDARYRHLVLDEFQDTNPLQWAALRGWLEAYGDDAQRPTVLMVGDPKQSIYRFRRADPRLFEAAGTWLVSRWGATTDERNDTRRNAQAVVDIVNRVFDGVMEFGRFMPQTTHQADLPGRVEVLPLVKPVAAEASTAGAGLRDPLMRARAEVRDERRLEEGRRLAARLGQLFGRMRVRESGTWRPARPGDAMILARTRKAFAEIELALREARIPYASGRGGGLLEALEVQDLLALLGWIVAPRDDLKLAHALKSPLFGIADADLVSLAQCGPPDSDWWSRLRANDDPGPALAQARGLLEGWRAEADRLPVHDLLDRIYHQGEVHARYAAAVPGPSVAGVLANLDAFIALALAEDAGRFPSLPRFLDTQRSARRGPDEEAPDEGEVDQDARGDVVRLMTIHGAKGLEAPIVCLVDANGSPARHESYEPLIDWPAGATAPAHFSLLTTQAEIGRGRAAIQAASREAALREELNLLYVAMTRAQQLLLVSGSEGKNVPVAVGGAWQRVREAVAAQAGITPADDALAAWGTLDAQAGASDAATPAAANPEPEPDDPAVGPVGERRPAESPQQRDGVALHAALQWLAEARDARAAAPDDRRLARLCGIRADQVARYRRRAEAAMDAPHLARFFDPQAFVRAANEFEVIAPEGTRRLDRVVEFESEVWVLDYKRSLAQADMAAYEAQVRDYLRLLAPLYPAKALRGALIDVAEVRLVPVPAA